MISLATVPLWAGPFDSTDSVDISSRKFWGLWTTSPKSYQEASRLLCGLFTALHQVVAQPGFHATQHYPFLEPHSHDVLGVKVNNTEGTVVLNELIIGTQRLGMKMNHLGEVYSATEAQLHVVLSPCQPQLVPCDRSVTGEKKKSLST